MGLAIGWQSCLPTQEFKYVENKVIIIDEKPAPIELGQTISNSLGQHEDWDQVYHMLNSQCQFRMQQWIIQMAPQLWEVHSYSMDNQHIQKHDELHKCIIDDFVNKEWLKAKNWPRDPCIFF